MKKYGIKFIPLINNLKRMNIKALNIHSIYEGIGRYSELIANVIGENNVLSFIPDKRKHDLIYRGKVVHGFKPLLTNGWFFNMALAKLKLRKYIESKVLMHYLSPILLMNTPGIVTIHDLNYLGNFDNKIVKSKMIKNLEQAMETKNILTVSNQSKKSLLEYGFKNVKLIDLCALPVFRRLSEEKIRLRRKYNLPLNKTLVLTVGHGDTATVDLAIKKNGFTHVHVGPERADIKFEKLSNEQLNEIYNSSDLFVRITAVEGFGSPAMEASTVGIPIVVSDIDVYREIYGDSAIYSQPDVNSVAASIKDAINAREELTFNFSKRSSHFSFARFKKEMLDYYDLVYKKNIV